MKNFTLSLLLLSFCLTGFGQWNNNPSENNLVANSPGYDSEPVAVSDGAGGSLVCHQLRHITLAAGVQVDIGQ